MMSKVKKCVYCGDPFKYKHRHPDEEPDDSPTLVCNGFECMCKIELSMLHEGCWYNRYVSLSAGVVKGTPVTILREGKTMDTRATGVTMASKGKGLYLMVEWETQCSKFTKGIPYAQVDQLNPDLLDLSGRVRSPKFATALGKLLAVHARKK